MAWKIGVLGLIHDHVWTHITEMNERGDVEVSVADPNQPLLDKAQAEYGVERLYHDPADLLAQERPDAVLVFSDNAGTASLVEMAASFGIPVMVEKPLADNLADAERIRVAVARAGIRLMVNWPTNWMPEVRHALTLAADGAIGDLIRFSFRGGHQGPREYGCTPYFYNWLYDPARNGAGAYIDYSGYGTSMARLLLGMPSRAQATIGRLRKEDIAVDDNAVLVLRYPRALAVIEASWTAAGPIPESGPMIWGSEGTLVVSRSAGSRGVHLFSQEQPQRRELDVPALPQGERNAVDYFLSCLSQDRPFEGLVSLEVGRDTQEILEAGLIAATSGHEVSLPLSIYGRD